MARSSLGAVCSTVTLYPLLMNQQKPKLSPSKEKMRGAPRNVRDDMKEEVHSCLDIMCVMPQLMNCDAVPDTRTVQCVKL